MIRNYRKEEFEMINSWWKAAKEIGPLPDMLPEESTFILEMEKQPALCVTVYLTNSKEIAYIENFIGNPELKGIRSYMVPKLFDHICKFARERGYRRLVALASNEKLVSRYQEIGLTETVKGLTSFAKELF